MITMLSPIVKALLRLQDSLATGTRRRAPGAWGASAAAAKRLGERLEPAQQCEGGRLTEPAERGELDRFRQTPDLRQPLFPDRAPELVDHGEQARRPLPARGALAARLVGVEAEPRLDDPHHGLAGGNRDDASPARRHAPARL